MEKYLNDVGSIYIDTAPIIYYLENNIKYSDYIEIILNYIDCNKIRGVTSSLTLHEVLVMPLRNGDIELADMYYDLLVSGSIVFVPDITMGINMKAAELRAVNKGLKYPDAVHLAIANEMSCDAFLTNDKRLYNLIGVGALNILCLEDILNT